MPRAGTSLADFENTLTHELGHLQGLDHTCKDAATPAHEVDENGNPPPRCRSLSTCRADRSRSSDATMYNSATPGETKKRSPEADDVAGICDAYPLAQAAQRASCTHDRPRTTSRRRVQHFAAAHRAARPPRILLAALAALLRRARHLLEVSASRVALASSNFRGGNRETGILAVRRRWSRLRLGSSGTVVTPEPATPVQDNFFRHLGNSVGNCLAARLLRGRRGQRRHGHRERRHRRAASSIRSPATTIRASRVRSTSVASTCCCSSRTPRAASSRRSTSAPRTCRPLGRLT